MNEFDTIDQFSSTNKPKRDLDGAGSTLAMGIISIPFFGGFIGLILAILTLNRAKGALQLYNQEPDLYTESSMKKVKAGKTCAIVSLSMLGAALLIILLVVSAN